VTFPIMMAFGGLMGFVGVPLPGMEIGIALSMVVLGGAVMLKARPPLSVVMVIAAFFAIFHDYLSVEPGDAVSDHSKRSSQISRRNVKSSMWRVNGIERATPTVARDHNND
jgi:hydrogenase/urease accessory protein HupE